jgi:GR25 family glycosyltransferase involved in LPS biosynthesis
MDQAQKLIHSGKAFCPDIDIEIFNASIVEDVVPQMTEYGLKWNYPWSKSVHDLHSGLFKKPYETATPEKRIACFLSHYRLWKKCIEMNEPIFVFEDDAVFIDTLNVEELLTSKYDVISLNDPRGCTRRAQAYYEILVDKGNGVWSVPVIDALEIPQGLPGNSAYLIKPEGAKKLMQLVKEFGAWPNDAIMCRQLMPRRLGCVVPFATTIQKTKSNTTT